MPIQQYVYLFIRPPALAGSDKNREFANQLEENYADPEIINHVIRGTARSRVCLIGVTYPFRSEQEKRYGAKFLVARDVKPGVPVTSVALVDEEHLRNYLHAIGKTDALSVLNSTLAEEFSEKKEYIDPWDDERFWDDFDPLNENDRQL